MFERNRVDSSPAPTFVPVDLTMVDGGRLSGKLAVPLGRSVADAINKDGGFIDFEPYTGERCFVSKAQIVEIKLVTFQAAPELAPRDRTDEFDPHAVLGVPASAPWDDVRQAYVQLSKSYHPDRYSTAVLPAEVKHYLEVMARRINTAYAALDATHKVARHSPIVRSAPIYTSQPRG